LNITEVRVKLLSGRPDRLRAFCSITFDDEFVVHDLRVIEGRTGLFVAMPSRKLSDNCPKCSAKNHLRAKFCSECGTRLDENRAKGREKFHVDVAHPILPACREMIQSKVLEAYRRTVAEGTEARDASGEEEDYAELAEEVWDTEPEEEAGLDAARVEGPAELVREEPEDYEADIERTDTEQGADSRAEPQRSRRQKRQGSFGEGIL